MIFVDCPGFFKPRNMLGKKLNDIVLKVIGDSDLIVVMVDAAGGIGAGDFYIFNYIKTRPQQKILLLNKIDLVSKQKIRKEKEKLNSYDFFDCVHEVSAKTGQNIDKFLKTLEESLPDGPPAGKIIGNDNFLKMRTEYYLCRGWDSEGIPTQEIIDKYGFNTEPIMRL